MNKYYLFIIWNKALWCKRKILEDLNKSFDVINQIEIVWSNKNFEENLKSFYGRKLGYAEDKISSCGKGKFLLILINDNNPRYEERRMFDGYEIVNSNIYDKKELYRKWTAGSHRIHCSDTKEETEHDLVVLFGNNNEEINKLSLYSKDTKGVVGFDSKKELLECLNRFGNNVVIEKNDELTVIAKCRYDIVSFIKCKEISSNIYSLNTNNENLIINIFGELDGDLPKNSYSTIINNKEIIDMIINNKKEYIEYIINKNNQMFDRLFKDNNLNINFKQENPNRIGHFEWYKKLLSEIKLIIKKIMNGC